MTSPAADLSAENRILRERIAQLENSLRTQSDPILKALIENAPQYLNVITPEGRFIATGRSNERFGSVIGRSIFEFIDEASHATLRAAFTRVVASREPTVYESAGYAEDGEPGRTYIVRVVPIIEAERVTALLLVPTDITERVRLERSLVESEQTLRLAVEASRLGLWRWDVNKDEIHWDARTREIFGVEITPATYREYERLIHPDDRELVRGVAARALETGVYPTFEHRLVTEPGAAERWLLAAGTVLMTPHGKAATLMGGVLDISEQKRLAAQLARAERVESIGQLTAGIAHNFNNLLTAIIPNVELASKAARDQEQPLLAAALDASLQARDLVGSLLALAGRRGLQQEPDCDVREVVLRVESICRMTFPREIDLAASVPSDPCRVRMPASDLEQVLLNLLFNARDAVLAVHGPTRQIEVVVDRMLACDGGRVRVRVRDSGVGMPELVRRRVFEPFFTTKPIHRGSGLGLSNAMARVRDANGSLECESAVGAGATFSLWLHEADVPRAVHDPVVPEPRVSRGETVLIVDDEAMVRDIIRRLLHSQGYRVLEAGSAAEARSVIEREGARIDLIILDHSMPKESGLESLPLVRARCDAPVVLFTGLAPELPDGIAALLMKPARPAELFRLVRTVIDSARGELAAS